MLKIVMLSVWAWQDLCCDDECDWDKRGVQMSPATHHMSNIDPYKTDTDEFQQIQYIGFLEEAKKYPKSAMLSVWAWPDLCCDECVWNDRGVQMSPDNGSIQD
jgi:hypothetical protein